MKKKRIPITGSRTTFSPVIFAAYSGYLGLLDAIIDPQKIDEAGYMYIGSNSYTPLTAACSQNQFDIISYLIQKGADVNAPDNVQFIFSIFSF